MKWSTLFLLLGSLALAQASYYSRPGAGGPYEVLYQRPGEGGAKEPTPAPLFPAPGVGGMDVAGGFPGYLPPPGGLPPLEGRGAALPTGPIPPGSLLKGRLLTGLLATPLANTPVLLSLEDTWCGKDSCPRAVLIGQASFSPNARAEVIFTALVQEGTLYSLYGVAFDPEDRLYGLTGKVTDVAPTLAADLLRSAAGGLVDWVQALNRQGQVSILPGGGATTSFEAAPLWAYALGRLGSTLSLPQGTTTIVRALIRGAGDTVLVAILPSRTDGRGGP